MDYDRLKKNLNSLLAPLESKEANSHKVLIALTKTCISLVEDNKSIRAELNECKTKIRNVTNKVDDNYNNSTDGRTQSFMDDVLGKFGKK